ncbi:MAG: hypothetical protein ACO3A2_07975 [Bdellovibrionia bacterium]
MQTNIHRVVGIMSLVLTLPVAFADDAVGEKKSEPVIGGEKAPLTRRAPPGDAGHLKSQRSTAREKEAEGTHAPNRFDSDTFIKSRYEYNGQSLEVDTD